MNQIQQEKVKLRKEIYSLKKRYSQEVILAHSQEVLSVLELTGVFQEAKTIFIYNSLRDEVQTVDFIKQWSLNKDFYLPVVVADDLVFRKYSTKTNLQESRYGVMEPVGEDFTDYKKVDLIIVPGMAFDRKKNRLGRGKGFYDRFLPKLNAPKLGLSFEFQLFDNIPCGKEDIKMDYIVSENELIW